MSATTLALAGIAAATLVSEDATAVATGLAVAEGRLAPLPAIAACAIGIYLGDLGLWAAGRFGGSRVLALPGLAKYQHVVGGLAGLVDRHPALAILASRFTPGARLPLYVAAGARGNRRRVFFLWSFIAVAIWTPLIVVSIALAGDAIAGPIDTWLGSGWIVRASLVAAAFVGLRKAAAAPRLDLESRTRRWRAAIDRWRRWEFWPAWLFNVPIVLWVACLALRYRSLTLFTLANPGIPLGGFVGESKSDILAKLPQDCVLPWATIETGSVQTRLDAVRTAMATRGWQFPLVFKPDVGQRGAGVRWVRDDEGARAYLSAERGRVVIQVPHDGPFEAGLFYVRKPSERVGRLFSITDKRFPAVVGDGIATVEELVARHPRYRLQERVFSARLREQWRRVPSPGERVALGMAGNHCQGTEFLDGTWLATPALARRIDAIARQVPGFHFGRFDVRYSDRGRFMAGHDIHVVELNGVTSEATHIYDPSASLVDGWRTLMRQWSLAFAIGEEHRQKGLRPAALRELVRATWTFLRHSARQTAWD
jgi:membrane protein DedA with SNARE-associated domain